MTDTNNPWPTTSVPHADESGSTTVTVRESNVPLPDDNTEREDEKEVKFYVVDAHTNTVYHGLIHEDLQKAYDAKGKRLVPSPATSHVNGVKPVLARFATKLDPVTNMDVTTWYPVTEGNIGELPGPLPGEWKMVHIVPESEV